MKSCHVRWQRRGTQGGAKNCGRCLQSRATTGPVSRLHAEGTAPPSDPVGPLLPTVHSSTVEKPCYRGKKTASTGQGPGSRMRSSRSTLLVHTGDNSPRNVPHLHLPPPPGQRPEGPALGPQQSLRSQVPFGGHYPTRLGALAPHSAGGETQLLLQHRASWPLESLLKHHQCVMPASFLGENKSYFSLFFFPLMEKTKTPFEFNFSGIKKKIKKQICQNSHPAFLVTFFNSVGSMWGSLLLIGRPGGFAAQAEECLREGWRRWRRDSEQESTGLIRKT